MSERDDLLEIATKLRHFADSLYRYDEDREVILQAVDILLEKCGIEQQWKE